MSYSCKSLSTKRALMWFSLLMNWINMSFQMPSCTKSVITNRTLVFLFLNWYAFSNCASVKATITNRTCVASLFQKLFDVIFENILMWKSKITSRALIFFMNCQNVLVKVFFCSRSIFTKFTLEWFLSFMNCLNVLFEALFYSRSIFTKFTVKWGELHITYSFTLSTPHCSYTYWGQRPYCL